MKTIQEILNISEEAYQFYIWQTWLAWASCHNKTPQELQALIANTSLFNWWMKEYRTLENEFKVKVNPYIGKVSTQELFNLYDKETDRIAIYYSKPLIKQALKAKVINQLQLN